MSAPLNVRGSSSSHNVILPPPPAKKEESSLQQLLAGNPGLKTNQDLINHCYKAGGNTFEGAAKVAKDLGADLNQLVKSREAPLARETAGTGGTNAATTTNGTNGTAAARAQAQADAFDTSAVTNPKLTGANTTRLTGDVPTVKVDSAAKAQLDSVRTQAHLGGGHATTKTTGGQGAHGAEGHHDIPDNLAGAKGAKDSAGESLGGGVDHLHSGKAMSKSITRHQDGAVVRESSNTRVTNDKDGGGLSVTTGDKSVKKGGTAVRTETTESATVRDKNGNTLTSADRVVDKNGKLSATRTDTEAKKPGLGEKIKDAAHEGVQDTKFTLYRKDYEIAEGNLGGKGVKEFGEKLSAGRDPKDWKTGKYDGTGAGVKTDVLAYEVNAGYGAYAQKGKLHAGADVNASFVAAGVSARAQAGKSSSVLGAVSASGEAKVAAEGSAGAKVTVDLTKNPTVELSAGAKAFAGAKAEGSVAYQNKYVGVTAKGEASAGIGGEASAGVSLKNGRLKVSASLSGTLGVGLGGKIELDVNVGAIAKDTWNGVKSAGSWVGSKLGLW